MKKEIRKKEEKEKFNFGKLFNKSFEEYKGNLKELMKFMLIFVGMLLVVATLFDIIVLIADPEIFEIMSTPELLDQFNQGNIELPFYYVAITSIFSLVTLFLTLFISAGLISTSLKKSKFSFKEIVENAKSRYWQFFGFSFVLGIFILLLTLLFIIPGIIFGVFWVFAAYVFFDEKKDIMGSIKESKKIVKNRWWKTFGYILLFGLVSLLIIIVASIIQLPTSVMTLLSVISGSKMSLGLLIASSILSLIYTFVYTAVITPLSALFFKNFYLEMKKSVVKDTKKKK
jgi:hypothetical protein